MLWVRAVDAVGNVDTAGVKNFSWTADFTAASTFLDSHPPALSASSSAQFSFGCSDGPGQCAFRYLLDAAVVGPSTPWASFGLGSYVGTIQTTTTAVTLLTAAVQTSYGLASASRRLVFQLSAPVLVAVRFEYRILEQHGGGVGEWQPLALGNVFVPLERPSDGRFTLEVRLLLSCPLLALRRYLLVLVFRRQLATFLFNLMLSLTYFQPDKLVTSTALRRRLTHIPTRLIATGAN